MTDEWLPRRLAAEVGVISAETRLFRTAWRVMRQWLAEARDAALASVVTASSFEMPPDVMAILARSESWMRLVGAELVAVIEAILGERYAALLGEDFQWDNRPYVIDYIDSVRNRLRGIPDTAYAQVQARVQEQVAVGATVPQLRDAVAQELSTTVGGTQNQWRERAVRIARTELIGAYNGGSYDAARALSDATGEELYKVWVATSDARTRPTHRAADEQHVPLDGQFTVGGAQMRFPGDPTAPADEVINCRCTFVTVDAEDIEGVA